MNKITKLVTLSVLVPFYFGCSFSFHSTQYNALTAFLKEIKGASDFDDLEPSWLLIWNSLEIEVLPVSVADDIWFVGEDEEVVSFDGWQITKVENLLPAGLTVNIDVKESNLIVTSQTREVARFDCDPWRLVKKASLEGGQTYVQACRLQKMSFQNEIHLDTDGVIRTLDYKVHPNYPSLKLVRSVL